MKITDVKAFVVMPDLGPSTRQASALSEWQWTFVTIQTDEGITGWGECYASSVGPAAMEGVIRDVFSDLLFPGISTIQTRARYFLIVPWIYQRHEKRRTSSACSRSRVRPACAGVLCSSSRSSSSPSGAACS